MSAKGIPKQFAVLAGPSLQITQTGPNAPWPELVGYRFAATLYVGPLGPVVPVEWL